ncbi:MAG: 16S rRNA (uracil(1498)-N(3))-methyltransferase [Prevotella sp.]|nr:16S rRNA (uracil(1498)-N(3))-methyltransferase [Prevotella sp.]
MKEARYFYVPQAAGQNELPPDEATHALRVLRLQVGDELFLMDGTGCFYRAEVAEVSSKRCRYNILERQPQKSTWNGRIHLAIAPTKMMERMEWLAEKATEVGFDELSFLNCRFSERRQLRQDRVEKIVVSAMKQSRKAWLPVVNGLKDFRKFIEEPRPGRKFIAHCYDEVPRIDLFNALSSADGATRQDEPITVLVGPEGDFSIDEVRLAEANGYVSVTLGESRLRTETAGLAAVMMAQLAQRKQ